MFFSAETKSAALQSDPVSRTVYAGDATTVTVGQSLPGGGKAVDDGSFPNVFKNESADPSFGVSSRIFIDQLTTSGALINTRAIDANLITSSFASKSELALNVSTDGTAVPFMGYAAPPNTLDVSNSNTAAVHDSTNPVQSTYARAVGQISLATGALQVDNVNSYSGKTVWPRCWPMAITTRSAMPATAAATARR